MRHVELTAAINAEPWDRAIPLGGNADLRFWLHASGAARAAFAELTRPIDGAKPHQRHVLARTLLASIEKPGSAPQLAARLGVHPGTIHYRMRTLRKAYGDCLDEPECTLPLMLALKLELES